MIFAEIDRRLSAIEGLAEYERMPAGDPAQYPALHLLDDELGTVEEENGTTRWRLTFSLEGFVTGAGGAVVHDAMHALHANSVASLCADAGFNLGGLVETVEPIGRRRLIRPVLSEERWLGFSQPFSATFATRQGDPHQFA